MDFPVKEGWGSPCLVILFWSTALYNFDPHFIFNNIIFLKINVFCKLVL